MLEGRRRYEGIRHAQPQLALDASGALGDRPIDGDLGVRAEGGGQDRGGIPLGFEVDVERPPDDLSEADPPALTISSIRRRCCSVR